MMIEKMSVRNCASPSEQKALKMKSTVRYSKSAEAIHGLGQKS